MRTGDGHPSGPNPQTPPPVCFPTVLVAVFSPRGSSVVYSSAVRPFAHSFCFLCGQELVRLLSSCVSPFPQPDMYPGNCWAFRGSQGYLVVRLSMKIHPTGFALEHIPKALSPTGNISSAPKDFAVYVSGRSGGSRGCRGPRAVCRPWHSE